MTAAGACQAVASPISSLCPLLCISLALIHLEITGFAAGSSVWFFSTQLSTLSACQSLLRLYLQLCKAVSSEQDRHIQPRALGIDEKIHAFHFLASWSSNKLNADCSPFRWQDQMWDWARRFPHPRCIFGFKLKPKHWTSPCGPAVWELCSMWGSRVCLSNEFAASAVLHVMGSAWCRALFIDWFLLEITGFCVRPASGPWWIEIHALLLVALSSIGMKWGELFFFSRQESKNLGICQVSRIHKRFSQRVLVLSSVMLWDALDSLHLSSFSLVLGY